MIFTLNLVDTSSSVNREVRCYFGGETVHWFIFSWLDGVAPLVYSWPFAQILGSWPPSGVAGGPTETHSCSDMKGQLLEECYPHY